MENAINKLVELEKGFWNAAGSDGSYYEENFAADGVMVLPFEGGTLNKTQTIETVKQAGAWSGFDITQPRLFDISENETFLLYKANGRRADGQEYYALISSLYRRHGSGWELVFHQQTPLA